VLDCTELLTYGADDDDDDEEEGWERKQREVTVVGTDTTGCGA
jgi:hypothetical protein